MRPIDADAIKLSKGFFEEVDNVPKFYEWLNEQPTIEPKHGQWIYTEVREYPRGFNLVKCSYCNWSHHSRPGEKWILTAEEVARDFNYCPYCGAKMERSEE